MPFLGVRTGRIWGTVFDRCTAENFDIALALRLESSDVKDARQVFLILNNGSSHHPNTSPKRIQSLFPQITTVHLPIQASWLNQVEIYNSIIKRKALRPADFASVAEVERRIYAFEQYCNCFAEPFGWKYGREDLKALLAKLAEREGVYRSALIRAGLNYDGSSRERASPVPGDLNPAPRGPG